MQIAQALAGPALGQHLVNVRLVFAGNNEAE